MILAHFITIFFFIRTKCWIDISYHVQKTLIKVLERINLWISSISQILYCTSSEKLSGKSKEAFYSIQFLVYSVTNSMLFSIDWERFVAPFHQCFSKLLQFEMFPSLFVYACFYTFFMRLRWSIKYHGEPLFPF